MDLYKINIRRKHTVENKKVKKMKNIKIIGGGLSGLSAAINLVKAGYNVDVFEKRDECGRRFNGDLEGLEITFPDGNICSPDPDSGCSVTVKFIIDNTVSTTGGHPITITGDGGEQTHSATFTLMIIAGPIP